ncbi:hypothetical protein P8452_31631 [Trifolium repens]|nr:hypothetical protein P8452_31631 [Trifolium repens]
MHRRDSRWSATRRQVTWRSATQQKHDGRDEAVGKRNENTTKATGAVAKTLELSSSGMEIEIAELLYVSSFVSEEEKEQEVAMSLIMLSRDVRPWCGINSIAEFSDNNNHDDASHCDLFHESASCKRYFFDNLGQLSHKHDRNDSDNRFNVVLRRRFLRQVRCLVEEDETEQLKASVDYLVELCETVSPVDDSKFANLAHQSVEFILVGVFLCPRLDCRGPVVVACSFGSCLVAVCVGWQ